jgi:hypothetical protein
MNSLERQEWAYNMGACVAMMAGRAALQETASMIQEDLELDGESVVCYLNGVQDQLAKEVVHYERPDFVR